MEDDGRLHADRRMILRGGAAALTGLAVARPAAADTSVSASAAGGRRLPFLLDMVQSNPGEPAAESRFDDPRLLADYGYDGQVVNEFRPPHTAVTFDSVDPRIFPPGSDGRAWVEATARHIDERISRAHAAGLAAYYFTDIIMLPKRLVELHGDQLLDGSGRIDLARPFTQEVHRLMLREVFARFPGLDGLVVRTGETYLQNVPYHTGNNPVLHGADSHLTLLGILRDEVCERAGKRVFYRTWSTGDDKLTADPDYYRGVTDRVPVHDNLLFSIKHTARDFWRTVPFNPTIGVGRHRQIVEVQCQREYEGKGACPDYVLDGVINGFEEFRGAPGPTGLAHVAANPIVSGVWTWSRGGGWRGPYIGNELWCDLNTWVAARWTRDTGRTEADVFAEYAARAGLRGAAVGRFRRLALLSAAGTLRGHYSTVYPLSRLTWTRDQFLGGSDKDLTADFGRIHAAGLVEKVLEEKARAARAWAQITRLADTIPLRDREDRAYLRVSTRYGRCLYDVIHQGWQVMLRGFVGDTTGAYDTRAMARHLHAYDAAWARWHDLARDPGCATLYQPLGFGAKNADGLYDADPNHGMKPSVDRYRALLGA
ncbi:hypothetical protein ABZ554_26620 [Streptomyces sp. NPDC020125]|uniref:hypothetical protein n=1 Tax=Streptomyces sp. NPDC020125 TaxID=3154593 RepID=UPI0033FE03C9